MTCFDGQLQNAHHLHACHCAFTQYSVSYCHFLFDEFHPFFAQFFDSRSIFCLHTLNESKSFSKFSRWRRRPIQTYYQIYRDFLYYEQLWTTKKLQMRSQRQKSNRFPCYWDSALQHIKKSFSTLGPL